MSELNYNLNFEDLYARNGLIKVDRLWQKYLQSSNEEIYKQYRLAKKFSFDKKNESQLIIALAPFVEDFISRIFKIESEVSALSLKHNELTPIFKVKRLFIQRVAVRNYKEEENTKIPAIRENFTKLNINPADELNFAKQIEKWEAESNSEMLEEARIYAAWAVFDPEGKAFHKEGVLFKVPKKINNQELLHLKRNESNDLYSENIRMRAGFINKNTSISLKYVLDQANYCIHCHHQSKDTCSHGFKDASGNYRINELNNVLTGCPLDEKISEMNELKSKGSIIGALVTAMIDNPLLAATGNRICNDCMKACIYQKQEPVDIPGIESGVLDDVLSLPWGFEIYSLITRWNPLNFKYILPKKSKAQKVLVAGLGPAGFTMAHYMLNEGFTVVGIDGLKIESFDANISGIDEFGKRHIFNPIKNVKDELFENSNTRTPYGFGGVMEYGITIRWNKNYLKIIRLLLERRKNFRMYGGVRFGGAIDYKEAIKLGFDHIVLALGAGKPNLVNIKNILAKGCRTASDFLMSLQLTGAFRYDSLANLHVRLPVIVIGGGLTAIDTATESLAYYEVQVEKFLRNFEKLGDKIFDNLNSEEIEIAHEFIMHAKELRANPNDKLKLLKSWGGVKVAYRKTLQDSPAYRLNHEEVEKAFEEGIEFSENIVPFEIELDNYEAVKTLKYEGGQLNARTVLIATGTQPNTVLNNEDPINFILDGKYFKAVDESGRVLTPEKITKPLHVEVFHKLDDNLSVSFLGDLHPSFAGNVVKAMASAKQSFHKVSQLLNNKTSNSNLKTGKFLKELDKQLIATVHKIVRLTPEIIEVVIKAPLATEKFRPGQFYRLQNFEKYARNISGYKLGMEGIALTGASVNLKKGLISLIILEFGGSSKMCQFLKEGEPVVLMGPTGMPTEIPSNKNVMLAGGGLGNAVLFSIGQALRKAGSKVLYFAGYKKEIDRYKVAEIEAAADHVIWACDEKKLEKFRAQDFSFKGNIVEVIKEYGETSKESLSLNLQAIDHIIVIGSDKMMKAVTFARHNTLREFFKEGHIAIGSINSPMQCMMKEICGQCLQRHIDPISGEESYVYSCSNQDQLLDSVDFNHLSARLAQNSLQEKVCNKIILGS